jgi:AIPR protein
MDVTVTRNLSAFVDNFGFQSLEQYEQFERFCVYSILNREINRSLNDDDLEAISVGMNKGIDGIAFIVNGELIKNIESLQEVISKKGKLDISIYLFQTKISAKFEDKEVANFLDTIIDFTNDEPQYPFTSEVQSYHAVYSTILADVGLIKEFRLFAFYCSLGQWKEERPITITIRNKKQILEATKIFNRIEVTPIDRDKVIDLYKKASSPIETEFKFSQKVAIEEISGVKESYIGLLPFAEFRKLIIDPETEGLRNLFYDNVRDFLGVDNEVNEKILETLKKKKFSEFSLLNNGVTVIASENKGRGDKFKLTNYQIVNGCQTSNVLYQCKDFSDIAGVIIPIKIIITEDEVLRDSIILSTNNQTQVKEEQLLALTKFQKELEEYYSSVSEGIFYERRPFQYANRPDIKKKSIVEIREQIKSFVAMFLDEPHVVSGYFGKVYREKRDEIFIKDHLFEPYYIAGLIQYLFKEYLRSKEIDRKYNKARYHVFMLFRMLNEPESFLKSFLKTSKKNKAYFDNLFLVLRDKGKCLNSFNNIFKIIDDSGIDITDQKEIYKKATTNALIETYNKTYK